MRDRQLKSKVYLDFYRNKIRKIIVNHKNICVVL